MNSQKLFLGPPSISLGEIISFSLAGLITMISHGRQERKNTSQCFLFVQKRSPPSKSKLLWIISPMFCFCSQIEIHRATPRFCEPDGTLRQLLYLCAKHLGFLVGCLRKARLANTCILKGYSYCVCTNQKARVTRYKTHG